MREREGERLDGIDAFGLGLRGILSGCVVTWPPFFSHSLRGDHFPDDILVYFSTIFLMLRKKKLLFFNEIGFLMVDFFE